MRTRRHRGVSLTQVISMLPIIAAIGTVGTQVTVRVIRIERGVGHQTAEEAKLFDLTRRIERDAERAATAGVEQSGRTATLTFPHIQYVTADRRVTRTEKPANGPATSYSWDFELSNVRFAVETIAGQPRIVWVTCNSPALSDQGPDLERSWSQAARINAGGAS